jgi:MFS family permease
MSLVTIGLFALGALRPTTLSFLALLAVIGVGLGCFTPPNNASIMGSVPGHQAGLASGVLNMTRGMGTALGLALSALVFDLAGGSSAEGLRVDHALSVAAWFRAGAAAVAAVVAATGEKGPLSHSVFATVE